MATRRAFWAGSCSSRLETAQAPSRLQKHNGEQRMRLFIVPGIDESTAFAPKCRGEIGAYAWHLIDELPRTHGEATNVYLDSEGKRHRFYMVWQFIGDLVKWLRVPPKGKRAAEDAGGADGKREARARRAQDGVGPSTPVKPVDVVRVEAKKAKKGGDKGAEAATSQPQAEGKKAKKGANGAKAVAATEAAVPAVAQPEGKKAKKNGGKVATETVVPKVTCLLGLPGIWYGSSVFRTLWRMPQRLLSRATQAAAVQPAEAPKVAPPKAKAKQEVTPVGRAEGRMQPSTNVAPAPAASQKAAEVKVGRAWASGWLLLCWVWLWTHVTPGSACRELEGRPLCYARHRRRWRPWRRSAVCSIRSNSTCGGSRRLAALRRPRPPGRRPHARGRPTPPSAARPRGPGSSARSAWRPMCGARGPRHLRGPGQTRPPRYLRPGSFPPLRDPFLAPIPSMLSPCAHLTVHGQQQLPQGRLGPLQRRGRLLANSLQQRFVGSVFLHDLREPLFHFRREARGMRRNFLVHLGGGQCCCIRGGAAASPARPSDNWLFACVVWVGPRSRMHVQSAYFRLRAC